MAASNEVATVSSTDVAVWRYRDICALWGVSRATVERWVQQFEENGIGIPVHRDPSSRPYWLPHEAAPDADHELRGTLSDSRGVDQRVERLRRAARRNP